jgi:hypothetical protein
MLLSQTFKKLRLRTAASIAVAAFALISTAATTIPNSNFSGEWTFNEKKSELGDFGARFTPRKVKVQQKEDGLSIERITSFNGDDRTSTEKLSFDGKETENTVFGNSVKKSVAKWSDDGQTLTVNSVIKFDRNGDVMEIKSTEIWKLVNDGKSLQVETTSSSSMGTVNVKAVYDKAN